MKSKKGVEMSLQTIVIAALSVIILVVLIVLFTTQVGKTNDSINACEAKGYECESSCGEGYTYFGKQECEGDQHCCAPTDEII